jgi:hypothetical protein
MRSPVVLTGPDGQRYTILRHSLEGVATAPSPDKPFDDLFIFDSGWGGVNMVVELAKKLKNNSSVVQQSRVNIALSVQ